MIIVTRLGRWNAQHTHRFIYERIWWKGYRWTPFVKMRRRELPWEILEGENRAFRELLEPIKDHHRASLRHKAQELKLTGGEGWAIGEMLERACILLDAFDKAR